MTEVKDQLAEALKILVLDCEGYEAWCRPVYAVDNAREALAAYEADKARTSVNADGLVEALEYIVGVHHSDFSDNIVCNLMAKEAAKALAEHQKGGNK